MKDSEFYSLPKEDLLTAAKESQKSAQGHFNTGQYAASVNQYGIANSLLILAVEECIKSAILLAGYFGQTLPFSIEPYFKDHRTKHLQALEIQPLISFVWTVRGLFTDILQNRKSDYDTVLYLAFARLFAAFGFELSKKKTQEDFTQWWNDANTQKNNGFYVGYRNGKWNFPGATSIDSYRKAVSISEPFVECLAIVHSLKSADNLLFSADKVFSKEEINASEFKISPAEPIDPNDSFGPSNYRRQQTE